MKSRAPFENNRIGARRQSRRRAIYIAGIIAPLSLGAVGLALLRSESKPSAPATSQQAKVHRLADNEALIKVLRNLDQANAAAHSHHESDDHHAPGAHQNNAPVLDDDQRLRARLGNDPIASMAPTFANDPPATRLRKLKWMDRAPGNKIVSLFPDLVSSRDLPLDERAEIAHEMTAIFIQNLEAEGHSAPKGAAEGPPIAEIRPVDPSVPMMVPEGARVHPSDTVGVERFKQQQEAIAKAASGGAEP